MIRRPGLIHLSTPTLAPGIHLGSSQENDLKSVDYKSEDYKSNELESSRDNLGNKTQKKNGPGIFAKLLDGLMAKGKIEQKSDTSGNSENVELPEELEKKRFLMSISGNLNEATEPEGFELPGEESNPGAVFAFFGQNGEGSTVKAALHSVHAEGEFALKAENPFHELIPDEAGLKNFSLDRESKKENGERNTPANLVFDNAERPEADSLELHIGSKEKRADTGDHSQQLSDRKFTDRLSNERQSAAQHLAGHMASGEALVNAEIKSAADLRPGDLRKSAEHLQEARESRSRRGRHNIDFRDYRTGDIREALYVDPAKSQASLKPVGMELEIPVELKLSFEKPEGEAAGKSGSPPSLGKGFEDALARELRGNLSMDIVRNASIIARDGGEGTIRLSLRPASLGDVKVHLEMTENRIIGVIVVESNEALRAFERELPVLEKAFRDSGFSETSLEMSLAQDGGNYAGGEERQEEDFYVPYQVMAASRYEESERPELLDSFVPVHDGMILSPERTPVNLLV